LRVLFQAKQMRTTLEHERSRLNAWLAEQFGRDGLALHEEYVGSDFARWYQHRKRELEQWPTMYRLGTTGDFGCEVAYLLVRAAKPRVVVDTGVLYGASSAHILAALARNGTGELHSIDLGVAADEPPHDFFVPHDLKARWRLIIGDSRRVLPALLMRLGRVDLFHHDSLHTFEHMTWEYRTALPYLANGGVLSSDDVRIVHSLREVFRTNAFPAFCAAHGLRFGLFYNAGIALCGESSPARLSDADS
jgi:predicted O-methyltransferase YrrM